MTTDLVCYADRRSYEDAPDSSTDRYPADGLTAGASGLTATEPMCGRENAASNSLPKPPRPSGDSRTSSSGCTTPSAYASSDTFQVMNDHALEESRRSSKPPESSVPSRYSSHSRPSSSSSRTAPEPSRWSPDYQASTAPSTSSYYEASNHSRTTPSTYSSHTTLRQPSTSSYHNEAGGQSRTLPSTYSSHTALRQPSTSSSHNEAGGQSRTTTSSYSSRTTSKQPPASSYRNEGGGQLRTTTSSYINRNTSRQPSSSSYYGPGNNSPPSASSYHSSSSEADEYYRARNMIIQRQYGSRYSESSDNVSLLVLNLLCLNSRRGSRFEQYCCTDCVHRST